VVLNNRFTRSRSQRR